MKVISLCLLMSISFSGFAQQSNEFVDFNKIKKVLKKDGLDEVAKKKAQEEKKREAKKIKWMQRKYNLPKVTDFWSFATEYWLVKNAPILKWDVTKPDYGVSEFFAGFLNQFGHYGLKFKILYVNSPNITHMALPANQGEYIFLISIPFIRTMDLTKAEISLLLFEDFLRSKFGYFKSKVSSKELREVLGTNFYGKELKKDFLDNLMKKYDSIVWDKGFDVKEQYTVTKKIDSYLRSNLTYWNKYMRLLEKISNLTKTNVLYTNYNKIYPSPELQLKWLTPGEKRN